MPDEDMTAFLQHTLSTFTAHREEIEGLIKIRDGCCDKYLESNETHAPPTNLGVKTLDSQESATCGKRILIPVCGD